MFIQQSILGTMKMLWKCCRWLVGTMMGKELKKLK